MPSPPQCRSDPAGSGALLYVVLDLGVELIAELTRCARDGVPLNFDEPPAAATAGVQSGDFVLVIIQDDQIDKIATLSHVKLNEVTKEAVDDDEVTKEAVDDDDDEEHADQVEWFSHVMKDAYHKLQNMKESSQVDVRHKDKEEDAEYRDDGDDDDDEEEEDCLISLLNLDDDTSVELNSDEEVHSLPRYFIELRLWASHAVLVLHYVSHWKLTRQHHVHWLELTERDKTAVSLIDKDETHKACTKAFSTLLKEPTSAFKGFLESSDAAYRFINSKLTPHVDDFRFIKVLGVTADCKVYCCSYMDTSLGDVQFALKKMQITDEFDDEGAIDYQEPREVTIFSALKDSRIVTFIQAWACDGLYKTYLERSDTEEYDVCEDGPDPRYVIIQMNICSRTLEQLLPVGEGRAINVEVAWIIFTEITKALKYIHQNGVIHRDLKPGNIFFLSHDTYQVMIGDFGHSCWSKHYVDGKKGTPLRGTQLYAAPELDDTASDHTDKADIYSLGVILVEMFHSFSTGQEKGHVLTGLSNGKYPTKWEGDTVLLKRLTASSPSDRPSATEILDYMAKRQ